MKLKKNSVYSVFCSEVGHSIHTHIDFSTFFSVLYKGNGKFKFLGMYDTKNNLHRLKSGLLLACDNWTNKLVLLNDNVLWQMNCNWADYPIFAETPKKLGNLVRLLYWDIFYRHKTTVDNI